MSTTLFPYTTLFRSDALVGELLAVEFIGDVDAHLLFAGRAGDLGLREGREGGFADLGVLLGGGEAGFVGKLVLLRRPITGAERQCRDTGGDHRSETVHVNFPQNPAFL